MNKTYCKVGSVDITRNVSADFGAYFTSDVVGLGFDVEIRVNQAAHKGFRLDVRLLWLYFDLDIYSIHESASE